MEKLAVQAIDPEAMITHRFPFSELSRAFEVANDANARRESRCDFD